MEDIRRTGSGVKFSPDELATLRGSDLKEGIVYLGQMPLSTDQAYAIWHNVLKEYGDASSVPENILQQLGWITIALSPQEIHNLTIIDVDTVAAFGKYHGLSNIQLHAFAEKIRYDWISKVPEDYSYYDLMALQHILCGFNVSDIEKIHPESYREAAEELATIQHCPMYILHALADLASDAAAFGPTSDWSSTEVHMVGNILCGLDPLDFAAIPVYAMEGIESYVVPCLPPNSIRELSMQQLTSMSPESILALNQRQRNVLPPEKKRAIAAIENTQKKTYSNNFCDKNIKVTIGILHGFVLMLSCLLTL